ncbi:hypothetical protein PX52LOC_01524 [Limnoglobus roseus]|uniref:Uncharacterized protein n=2 Tax=Limnoglobus roseus TaxID=2598579 RepID=A0A5C1A9Z1_9BACT|nr:hypothetical protein PX52LOC_01524 [Limnoglobus roseus]
MLTMERKKPKKTKDTRKRQAILLPPEWHEVAVKLASKDGRPILWYVIRNLKEKAEAAGVSVPLAPWEEDIDDNGKSPAPKKK